MKFSGKSLMLLIVGITLIMVFSLGMVYIQSNEQQTELTEQLEIIQPVLDRTTVGDISPALAEMESRQQQAELELEAAKDSLRRPLYAVGIARELYDIAAANDVVITSLTSAGLVEDVRHGLDFSALTARLEVEGDTADLVAFIAAFSQHYPTGLIASLQMNIPDPADAGEAEEGEEAEPRLPSASMDVQIFTYEGD